MSTNPAELPVKAQSRPLLPDHDAARRALAKCIRVDDVKPIRNLAIAAAAWAREAKDITMVQQATDIRLRAERRAGELLHQMAKSGERAVRKNMKSQSATSKLSDLGVSKTQSSRWQRLADLSEPDFDHKVAKTARVAVAATEGNRALIREARAEQQAERQRRRIERELQLGAKLLALPDKRYGVIVADPEWKFEPWTEAGMGRAADNHYPTSATELIAARDVPSIAAKECVLFLWAIAPMLPEAIAVMAAWGFTYRTHAVWHKLRPGKGRGKGYWFTSEHELLLVGTTRAKTVAPATAICGSVIAAPVGLHSAKPEIYLELIEREFPSLPKIELNRRGPPRPGWDAWGLEAVAPSDCAAAGRL